ncbi:MAG: hypothetical protein KY454_04595 [Actinobacteria bacterium]|nr:hypothetical protein [Actinomycetota bacterium]
MPIGVRLQPEHLIALAGTDVDGTIVLHNPGSEAVRVRLVITSEIAGWASIEPGELWVPPGAEEVCQLRFRLPRGAPGGVGAVPYSIRVLSDQQGEGGASTTGTLEVTGEAQLALRLLPANPEGTFGATAKVAVDNLGTTPARVQLLVDGPPSAHVEVMPDSVMVEPGTTEFARLQVTPTRRLLAGAPKSHPFWVRLDPLGGARISASGEMVQRSILVTLLPKVAAGVVVVGLVALLLSRTVFGGADDTVVVSGLTTLPPTTTTTAPPTTVAPAVEVDATTTTVPLKDRRIAFQSMRDGNFEIYTAAPDGSDARNLSQNPAHDSEPAWSPDHLRIAFDSDRAGGFDIFVMDADGSNLVQLTTEPAPDGYPSWSPDGTKIAFISFRDGNSEIYVMDADGKNPKRLTRNANDDSHPAWSPDGDRIAFHSNRNGNFEIYVMKPDGSDVRNLTNSPGADVNPAWAPNGNRLAFDSTRDGGKPELYVMGADGSLPTRLTTNDATDTWPAWAPDGSRLAFQSDSSTDVEIYVVAVGGGAPRRLIESPGEDAEPNW